MKRWGLSPKSKSKAKAKVNPGFGMSDFVRTSDTPPSSPSKLKTFAGRFNPFGGNSKPSASRAGEGAAQADQRKTEPAGPPKASSADPEANPFEQGERVEDVTKERVEDETKERVDDEVKKRGRESGKAAKVNNTIVRRVTFTPLSYVC